MHRGTDNAAVRPDAISTWRTATAEAFARQIADHDARVVVREVEKTLREISGWLHVEYGSPDLGNLTDPTDEFAYIVLSRKTPERAYTRTFKALKTLGPWVEIRHVDRKLIEKTIRGGGLESKKATAILQGLKIIDQRFGAPDLSRAEHLDDDDLYAFLVSLPEVGPKSALCIMLYSFGRATFPVDAHVGRVLARVGVFDRAGVALARMSQKQRQRALRQLVPPDLRYGLHVGLVAHGRAVCRANRPVCASCVIKAACGHPGTSGDPHSSPRIPQ